MSTSKQATLASCLVVWHIARLRKLHAIAEILMRPSAIDIVCKMCGDDVGKPDMLLLFDDTVG